MSGFVQISESQSEQTAVFPAVGGRVRKVMPRSDFSARTPVSYVTLNLTHSASTAAK